MKWPLIRLTNSIGPPRLLGLVAREPETRFARDEVNLLSPAAEGPVLTKKFRDGRVRDKRNGFRVH